MRFRHRLFAGGWSGERVFDIIRRGEAVAVLLYDPDLDRIVLIEQFRLAALYGGRSPWQLESGRRADRHRHETPEEVARRETREESQSRSDRRAGADPEHAAGQRQPRRGHLALLRPGRFARRRRGPRPGRGARGHPRHGQDRSPRSKRCSMPAQIESAHTLVLLYWLLRHRDRLRSEWLSGQ